MTSLVIVAHAPLATAMLAVARHVFAERADAVVAVDVAADCSPEQAEQLIGEAVGRVARPAGANDPNATGGEGGGEVLILADVFGATPCNAAQRVADGVRVRLVAGLNVPMLWRAMAYGHLPLDGLIERALAGGAQGVMPASPQKPQDQPLHSQAHDPSHSHHQQ
ncbi:PTS fructose transporter subunit IIA [Ideonella sp.]|uniref:PTS sugar transporter subunit IIA n=1 Tax=Ideonella sp. TaxID=1929293 RepID=UPI002B45FE09|nr:PTS fructose transporter subunit IIA [Ideonella sp.]HJV71293.1 PTS fructose transporter subunit IIA [Ideonella sp.]